MALKNFRIEELGPIGGSTKGSFITDKPDFINFSPKYADPFITNFGAKLTLVDEVHSTRFYTKLIEQLTLAILVLIIGFRPKIRKLARYIDLAFTTTGMNQKQMGIQDVRIELKRKDVEKLLQRLKELLENCEANAAALEAVGFTEEKYTELKDMRTALKAKSDAQKEKMQDKARAVADNMTLFVEVEEIILDIMATGKALYTFEHKERLPEYTISTKLNQIRQEKTEEQIQIEKIENGCDLFVTYKDTEGHTLAGVGTSVVEYGMTAVSDAEGDSHVATVPMKPHGKVSVRSVLAGYVANTVSNVDLIAGEEVELHVVLRKVDDGGAPDEPPVS